MNGFGEAVAGFFGAFGFRTLPNIPAGLGIMKCLFDRNYLVYLNFTIFIDQAKRLKNIL